MKVCYPPYQTEILLICIWFTNLRYLISCRSSAWELDETNSQKATNSNTYKLTEIELATLNPGFSVDLLDAE